MDSLKTFHKTLMGLFETLQSQAASAFQTDPHKATILLVDETEAHLCLRNPALGWGINFSAEELWCL